MASDDPSDQPADQPADRPADQPGGQHRADEPVARSGIGRLVTGPVVRWLLLAAYLLLVAALMAPVLTTSVGADDRFWLMEVPGLSHGSLLEALWQPLRVALDFPVQNRATALSFAERQGLAVTVMNLSVALAVPPLVIWTAVKVALVALLAASVRLFCGAVRFRADDGTVRGLSRSTLDFVTLALPLGVALGVKAQDVGGFNGWNYYPTLCYGLLPGLLLIATVAMRLTDLLVSGYRRWVAPVVLLAAVWGVVVDFSFELLVAAVPLVALVVWLRPRPDGSLLRRWRAPVTVAGVFGLSWALGYVAIKVAVSGRSCGAGGACYSGTQVEVRPRTVLNNFLANLPVGTHDAVQRTAAAAGVPFPGVDRSAVALGVALVVLLAALLLISHRRAAATPVAAAGAPRAVRPDRREWRGLLVVLVVAAYVAVTCSVITGITSRAVVMVTSTSTSYHVGPVVWPALALGAIVVLRMLLVRLAPVGLLVSVLAAVLAVLVVGVMFPRNTLTAQANRQATTFPDFLHREVALGERSSAADTRRCTTLTRELATAPQRLASVNQRGIDAAYSAFAFYHQGRAFCSTRVGFTECPDRPWAEPAQADLPCDPPRGSALAPARESPGGP